MIDKKPFILKKIIWYSIIPLIVFPLLANANIKATDPTTGRKIKSVQLAANEKEAVLLEYITSNAGLVDIKISSSTEDLAPAVDPRWLVPWYQSELAGKAIKAKAGSVLINELLLKNPQLIRNDHSKKRSQIWIDDHYVSIDQMSLITSLKSIAADIYPLQDSKLIKPYHVSQKQRIYLYLLIDGSRLKTVGPQTLTIDFHENGKLVESTMLQIECLGFHLKESDIVHALYYRGKLSPYKDVYLSGDWKTEKQMLGEFRDIYDHGITRLTLYQSASSKTLLNKIKSFQQEVGIDVSEIYYLGEILRPGLTPSIMRKNLQKYETIREIYPDSKIYIYGMDEAEGEDITNQYLFWENLKKLGYGIIAAGSKEDVNKLVGYVDIFVAAHEPERKVAKIVHDNGGIVYVYANPQAGVENAPLYRKNYGFSLWQQEYDGAMTFAYQHTFGNNIWDDFDSSDYRDHVFAYPTATGVINTLAWEGYREAVDDLRYLSTYFKLLERKKSQLGPQYYDEKSWIASLKEKHNIDPAKTRRAIVKKISLLQSI